MEKILAKLHNNELCMARIWNNGKGGQCHKRPIVGTDFCGCHKMTAHGRVDGPIPPKKLAAFMSERLPEQHTLVTWKDTRSEEVSKMVDLLQQELRAPQQDSWQAMRTLWEIHLRKGSKSKGSKRPREERDDDTQGKGSKCPRLERGTVRPVKRFRSFYGECGPLMGGNVPNANIRNMVLGRFRVGLEQAWAPKKTLFSYGKAMFRPGGADRPLLSLFRNIKMLKVLYNKLEEYHKRELWSKRTHIGVETLPQGSRARTFLDLLPHQPLPPAEVSAGEAVVQYAIVTIIRQHLLATDIAEYEPADLFDEWSERRPPRPVAARTKGAESYSEWFHRMEQESKFKVGFHFSGKWITGALFGSPFWASFDSPMDGGHEFEEPSSDSDL